MKMLMAAFRNVWMAAVTLGDKWWTCKWSNKEIIYDSIYVGWHIEKGYFFHWNKNWNRQKIANFF